MQREFSSKGGFSMTCTLIVGVLAMMVSVALQAQGPKPGPEHKKLAVFLGSWSVDGEFKPSNAYEVEKFVTNVV
jgi:hypothetical protein